MVQNSEKKPPKKEAKILELKGRESAKLQGQAKVGYGKKVGWLEEKEECGCGNICHKFPTFTSSGGANELSRSSNDTYA